MVGQASACHEIGGQTLACPKLFPTMDKTFYRRHLSHYTPRGVDYFITYHLSGSLPISGLKELQRKYRAAIEQMEFDRMSTTGGMEPPDAAEIKSNIRKRYFAAYDSALDTIDTGPHWLKDDAIATTVRDRFHTLEAEHHLDLWCYTIMPNHVYL